MNTEQKDFFRIKETFTAVAIDDYTNHIISNGNANILMDGEKADVKNEEGYHIFLGQQQEVCRLCAGGWLYQQQDMTVDLKQERRYPVMKVRLLPNEQYIIGKSSTVIQGAAKPGSKIFFLLSEKKNPYKLYKDYTAGEEKIHIYHLSDSYLDGKMFCIQNPEKEREEFFVEEPLENEHEFFISHSLKGSYKKTEAVIKRIYPVTADEKGQFFFVVPKELDDTKAYEYYLSGDPENIKKGSFETGKRNKIE